MDQGRPNPIGLAPTMFFFGGGYGAETEATGGFINLRSRLYASAVLAINVCFRYCTSKSCPVYSQAAANFCLIPGGLVEKWEVAKHAHEKLRGRCGH